MAPETTPSIHEPTAEELAEFQRGIINVGEEHREIMARSRQSGTPKRWDVKTPLWHAIEPQSFPSVRKFANTYENAIGSEDLRGLPLRYFRKIVNKEPDIEILSGRVNQDLAQKVAHLLGKKSDGLYIGEPFGNVETTAKLTESVRDKDVFVIEPITWTKKDGSERNMILTPSEALVELCLAIYTIRSSTVKRVTAVIPYLGWQQSDKKDEPRIGILLRFITDMITAAGPHRVVLMDLHADQTQGFFDPTKVGVDHLYSGWVMLPYVKEYLDAHGWTNVSVVSPDEGGVRRAGYMAKNLGAGTAYGDKTRKDEKGAELLGLVGDVKAKDIVIWDDVINTGGSLEKLAERLHKEGARRIIVAVAHGGLNRDAVRRLHECPYIEKVFITDSIPLGDKLQFKGADGEVTTTDKIEVVSVARMLAEAIYRIHNDISVSDELFLNPKGKKKIIPE